MDFGVKSREEKTGFRERRDKKQFAEWRRKKMNNNINHESGLPVNGQQVTISQTACRFWRTGLPDVNPRAITRKRLASFGEPVGQL